MRNILLKKEVQAVSMLGKVKNIFKSKKGEGYVDSAVKILIAVVLGALLLAGLYLLFKDTVLPTLTAKIKAMFNYSG
ncbi:DUF6133 family protein [Clostridium cellulovorans]|uniref:Uncharacterized protein n=1 Tax=Clostridium cellulovorans (strain ATCC 35296 / DSM 3052 / OCM 3 / 743B) TaxID=573061 RepID=D9SP92_CLOC7|nr:DUF6133 family protein [Clostridium cellulovorans]ADL52057.1 hypothetical protein Clocel_2338 [Clostridium cellulovorans 743B]